MIAPVPRFAADSRLLLLLLSAVLAIPALSIDMGLPALSGIQRSLGATPGQAALTLSLFLLGFSTGPLVMGPVSDRYGRRPVLLAGLTVFTLGGLACATAGGIGMLLTARLVQGLGAGAASAMPMAAVRDLHAGSRARTMMSHMALVTGLAPIIAPTLGAALLALGPWRLIYTVLAGIGSLLLLTCWTRFPESASSSKRTSLHPRAILAGYAEALGHREFLGNAVVVSGGFSAMFAYIGGSPLVFMHLLGLSSAQFGAVFATTASMLMLGAFVNGRAAVHGVPAERMRDLALCLMAVATGALASEAVAGMLSVQALLPPICVTLFAQGILMPTGTHAALQVMGHRAGTATATLRALQMVAGFVTSAVVAAAFDGHSARSLASTMLACAILAGSARLLLLRQRAPAAASS